MTSRDFCFWLQGWFELNGTIHHREGATPEMLGMIRNHLALVFKHEIDPSIPDPTGSLQAIHDGVPATIQPGKPSIGGTSSDGIVYRC